MMHPYVQRQLRRHGISDTSEAMLPILKAVSALLYDVDRERELGAVAMNELSRELESRYDRLQQSEQRYRRLFDESPMAMFAVSRIDRRLIAWNHTAETTFGYTERDVLDQPIESLRLSGDDACLLAPMLAPDVPLPAPGTPVSATMHTRDGRTLDAEHRFEDTRIDAFAAASQIFLGSNLRFEAQKGQGNFAVGRTARRGLRGWGRCGQTADVFLVNLRAHM
jgi:PAS domain-containing protein